MAENGGIKYRCIIFDCDGVLVDSEAINNAVLVDMLNELGTELDLHYALENFAGKALSDVFGMVHTRFGVSVPEGFESRFRERTFARFRIEMRPVEGVPGLLQRIEVPYCVASNGPPDKMRINLEAAGLIDRFEGRMYSAYEIGRWKPDPALFLHAAEQMRCAPAECAVIEDSLSGVEAARRGGFDVFALAHANNAKRDALEAAGARVFEHMDRLDEWLRQ